MAKKAKSAVKRPRKAKGRIVEGAAIMSGHATLSGGPRVQSPLAGMIQDAMSQAVHAALAEGITDPVIQKERMMAARKAVLDRHRG
jgi:hypothetical protein